MRKQKGMGPKNVQISGANPEVKIRHQDNPERGFARGHHKGRHRGRSRKY